MWSDIAAGLINNLQLSHLTVVLVGTVAGLIIGALPGLSAVSGVALLLPFTFTMDPAQGLIMLSAVYMSAEYGGSISAILINTPGTSGAACTTLDGTPMTRRGEAQEALYLSLLGGTVGGLFGAIVLIFLTQPLAQASLLLGPSEIFWVAVAGLALVASLSGDNIVKGLLGTALGIGMTLVGQDIVTGDMRFTFDDYRLVGGIPLVPALLGLFTVASVLNLLEQPNEAVAPLNIRKGVMAHVIGRMAKMKILLLWTSALGTIIGIIPGAGASISAFVAYGEAKRISKRPEEFGKGSWEGVVAPETANNAVVGGALVPLLSLGIPGSGSAAIMFGALAVHGIIPGPRLFTERAELAYTFMIGLLFTVAAMLIVGLLTIRWSSLIVRAPRTMMVPGVLVLAVIGAYGLSNSVFDVYVLVAVGLVGYLLAKLDVPLVTVALGLVLGRLMEESYQQAALLAGVDERSILFYFLSRPLTLVLMLLALVVLVAGILPTLRERRSVKTAAPQERTAVAAPAAPAGTGLSMRAANVLLAAAVWALALFTVLETRSFSARAAQFPILTASVLAAVGVMLVLNSLRQASAAHDFPFSGVPWRHLLPVVATLLLFTVSVDTVGFYESGFLFATVTCWLLLLDSHLAKSPMTRIASAASFAFVLIAGVYVAFHLVLQVPTPPGIFF
jgi:putative tricarboxylic transport membrane protein